MEAITMMIDTKLRELKDSLLEEFTKKIDEFVNAKKDELSTFIGNEINKQVPVIINEQVPIINDERELSIKAVQKHVSELMAANRIMQAQNMLLHKKVEELEQYTRRPSVRIFGIPTVKKETSRDVENIVKKILVDYNTDILATSIDRAHRVGKPKRNDKGVEIQGIIVRFTSFRDRTKFYQQRKIMKEKGAKFSSVALDLTAERYALLHKAREQIENVDGIQFAYADINCNLRVFTGEGKHLLFDSLSDLQIIIANMEDFN